MFDPEKEVPSLELCKSLKELGYPQDGGGWYWVMREINKKVNFYQDLLPNENVFPIYSIKFVWSDNKYKENFTHYYYMYKEEKSFGEVLNDVYNQWINYIENKKYISGEKLKDLNPILKKIEVEFQGYDTWCLTWFSHYTYNTHLSDEDLLKSFRRYVRRKMIENRKAGKEEGWDLMGAEDEWRWEGPCRCEYCRKFGIVRINH